MNTRFLIVGCGYRNTQRIHKNPVSIMKNKSNVDVSVNILSIEGRDICSSGRAIRLCEFCVHVTVLVSAKPQFQGCMNYSPYGEYAKAAEYKKFNKVWIRSSSLTFSSGKRPPAFSLLLKFRNSKQKTCQKHVWQLIRIKSYGWPHQKID